MQLIQNKQSVFGIYLLNLQVLILSVIIDYAFYDSKTNSWGHFAVFPVFHVFKITQNGKQGSHRNSHAHINPYGIFELNMDKRIPIENIQ